MVSFIITDCHENKHNVVGNFHTTYKVHVENACLKFLPAHKCRGRPIGIWLRLKNAEVMCRSGHCLQDKRGVWQMESGNSSIQICNSVLYLVRIYGKPLQDTRR